MHNSFSAIKMAIFSKIKNADISMHDNCSKTKMIIYYAWIHPETISIIIQ
jgi:hypothetical protein